MSYKYLSSLDWKSIYDNFKSSGFSLRAFIKYKMPELLPSEVSIPCLATVAFYFKIIEQGRIPQKPKSPLLNKLDFKNLFLDMHAKGITTKDYYCTYIQGKYPISRSSFYRYMSIMKGSHNKVARIMEEKSINSEQLVKVTTISDSAYEDKSTIAATESNLCKRNKIPSKVSIKIAGLEISFESKQPELSVALVASYLKDLS